MARWYDKHCELGMYLDLMPAMSPAQRDELVKGVLAIIKENKPDLLTHFVLEFPLDLLRRRWYDKDPYLWLLLNGLQYADSSLIAEVIAYFKKNMPTCYTNKKVDS
ncbi:MAG: hypothetical protein ACE5NW_11210 [Acidiferrobacterales bacterium]